MERDNIDEGELKEILEIGVMHPAIPHLLIREPVSMIQQEHTDHEPHRFLRPSLLGEASRQLLIEPSLVDPFDQDH